MVVATGEPIPMESLQRSPKATPSTGSPDRPSLHCCERNSPVKNRMPEIGASGTVRGGDGNIPTYSESASVVPRGPHGEKVPATDLVRFSRGHDNSSPFLRRSTACFT
jgi:hypothetical protein